MDWRAEWKPLAWLGAFFLALYYLPVGQARFDNAVLEALLLLSEVLVLQGLIGSGMGKGPAVTLLLSGPALSLPSILVLRSIMGLKKTLVNVCLVIVMSTSAGVLFGWIS